MLHFIQSSPAFITFLEKMHILTAVRAKVGDPVERFYTLFPDMMKEVSGKRKQLHDLDVCFTLVYPAMLRFTWEGEKVSFMDPRKATTSRSEMECEVNRLAPVKAGKEGMGDVIRMW